MNEHIGSPVARAWPLFQSFAGWRLADLGPDVVAGLTLAAIAVPEQMATARLGGFAPEIGFLALIAGAVGFAVFGASRVMSVGADSTITPIFAGSLAAVVAAGSPQYAATAALLAVMVGAILIVGGLLRLGWVADLLSIPVTTGFLAGIAGHIVLSQAPALLGIPGYDGTFVDKVGALAGALGAANMLTLAIGLGVLAIIILGERLSPRIPAALIGLAGATALVAAFGLERFGVSSLGEVAGALPAFRTPDVSLDDVTRTAPLAFVVAVVVMVQTAATTRAFPGRAQEPDVNRDFLGVGAASVLAGLAGAFPVNASPPRTAVVTETGAFRSSAGSFARGSSWRFPPSARACWRMCRMRRWPACCFSWRKGSSAFRPSSTSGGGASRNSGSFVVNSRGGSVYADPAGRRDRHHPVAAAWRLDDDARPDGRVYAHPRHDDLVAEDRRADRRDLGGGAGGRASGAPLVSQCL